MRMDSHQQQVRESVVLPVAVPMMHNILPGQSPAKYPLENVAMLQHPTAIRTGIARNLNPHIAMRGVAARRM